MLGQPLFEQGGVVPRQQNGGVATGQHHGFVDGGVELAEVFFADVGQLRDKGHVHVALQRHGVKEGVVADVGQLGAVARRVGHDVFDRLQFGHVVAGFIGHFQLGVAGGQASAAVAFDGFADVALAPVVGGQCQVPVAKHAVQLFQVVERGTGGGQHVAAVVAEHVLAQVERFAGGGHKLPDACGLGAGDGLRVVGAFDVGQQRQFGGHVAPFQLLDDVEQVFAAARGHAFHVLGAAGVPLFAVAHQVMFQVWHSKAAPDAFPQVFGSGQRGDGRGATWHGQTQYRQRSIGQYRFVAAPWRLQHIGRAATRGGVSRGLTV